MNYFLYYYFASPFFTLWMTQLPYRLYPGSQYGTQISTKAQLRRGDNNGSKQERRDSVISKQAIRTPRESTSFITRPKRCKEREKVKGRGLTFPSSCTQLSLFNFGRRN